MGFELCGSTEFFSQKCYMVRVDSADVGLWMVVDVHVEFWLHGWGVVGALNSLVFKGQLYQSLNHQVVSSPGCYSQRINQSPLDIHTQTPHCSAQEMLLVLHTPMWGIGQGFQAGVVSYVLWIIPWTATAHIGSIGFCGSRSVDGTMKSRMTDTWSYVLLNVFIAW